MTESEIVTKYLPLIGKMARDMYATVPKTVQYDDLFQEASIGMLQAIRRHDPAKGANLQTLARQRMRGAMLDYLRSIDTLPRRTRQFQKDRDRLIEDAVSDGIEPTHSWLAAKLGLTQKQYEEKLRTVMAANAISLKRE
jgi:RNA polymerase sigma factor for flagellar operon FliA